MCLGDFNEIINLSEKLGGKEHHQSLMEAFKLALEDCALLDLGFQGPKFT
jgi:hypothetical protein